MTDTQLRIFFSKYSNVFVTSNIPHSSYSKILKVIEEADSEVEYDKNKINNNTYLAILEWILISIVISIAKDDKLLLAKLHRDITSITLIDTGKLGAMRWDTLAVLALFKFILPN